MNDIDRALAIARQHAKCAGAINFDAVTDTQQQLVSSRAVRNIMKLLGVGAGAGLAGRGLQGLWGLLRRNSQSPLVAPSGMQTIELTPRQKKEAAATSEHGLWWYYPAATSALLGSSYGSWKVLDKLLDKRRKSDVDAELETAKQRYRSAIVGDAKTAADGTLEKDLDLLAEAYEKQAFSGYDVPGALGGVALTSSGLATLLAAVAGYRSSKSRQRRTVLERAKKQRQLSQPPASMYVQLQPGK